MTRAYRTAADCLPAFRTTGAFHRFLDLPPELREIVYAFYFDEAKIAVKGQPCIKHATSILSVSRQLHNEASAVMFRAAAFTVHLGWHHTRNHEYDLARCFGRLVQPETYFVGRKEVFTRFRNFNFHLDVQKRRHLQKYWQHVAAVFYAMKVVMLETRGTCCLTINVGDLGRSSKGYRVLHESAVWVDRSDLSWRRKVPFDEHALPMINLPADTGQQWKAVTPPWRREIDARFRLIYWMSAVARDTGGSLWLESHDHKRRKVVKVDGPLGLLDLAAGFEEGRNVWLVMDGKR